MKTSSKTGQIGSAAESRYWRSIGESMGEVEQPDWADREFPEGAQELSEDFSRRDFLKLMSASAGLAGAGMLGVGCRRPEEHIVPFGNEQSDTQNYVHGVPMHFATAMPTRTGAVPLLALSNEGRPTKVEGNSNVPGCSGATDLFAQASILNLYDPDRAREYTKNGKRTSKADTVQELVILSKDDKKTAFLMPAANSPSRDRMIGKIRERLGGKVAFYVHEAIDFGVHHRGATLAFGQSVKPYWKLDEAKFILSLDCDFLGTEEGSERFAGDFARGRKVAKKTDSMSRLYSVEALLTQTGANADHRLRANAMAIPAAAAFLANQLGQEIEASAATKLTEKQQEWLRACADDLKAHEGKGLVVAGYRQPEAVHQLVHIINGALGNNGKTVDFLPAEVNENGSLTDLVSDLGKFDRVINLGCNPVYDGGADLNTDAVVKQTAFRLTHFKKDESHSQSDISAPRAHYLESWGDARTANGTIVPIQPLIAPLFDAMTELEVLSIFASPDIPQSAHEVVQKTFNGDSWERYLHDGYQEGTAYNPVSSLTLAETKVSFSGLPILNKDELEVVFTRDYSVDDGSYANNGWCQELPDPINKIAWDNVLSVSRKTADNRSLKNGKLATVKVGTREVTGPVWIQPGMADNTVALPLGYDRKGEFRVANFQYEGGSKDIPVGGYNAYKVRATSAVNVDKAGISGSSKDYPLSSTQEHWSMEGRPIVREATLDEFRKSEAKKEEATKKGEYNEKNFFPDNMGIGSHARNEGEIYQHPYKERPRLASDVHQWGMSIDLTACNGCNACVIACQSENNIPIVGKEQVAKGREMHWLRIDRYYTGRNHDPKASAGWIKDQGQNGDDEQHAEEWIDDPQVVNQPMACQHCENAPCESVCPVNATVHDEEGLNVMVYNRCVGTRYCSNNCAWKVRRFNFFDYNKRPIENLYRSSAMLKPSIALDWIVSREKSNRKEDEWDLLKLAKNPDVSVRMRGVMEKCTYCVQRIESTKINKKVAAGSGDNVQVVDEDGLKTACQQVCPAEAISFGNLMEDGSEVNVQKDNPRNYETLDFLDNKTRTTYLAKVRNPNAKMPDAYNKTFSTSEYHPENAHDTHHDGHEEKGDDHK